jgi:4-hydroxybenzoate polyprenyltransferase/phosphoserine phosphatase
MPSVLDIDTRIPLVVDLDGALLLTDTLHESIAKLVLSEPLAVLTCLPSLMSGRAAFKRKIVEHVIPDSKGLPYREPLLDLLKAEKTRGREIHLVTAADQTIAGAVAKTLNVFDTATGSDGVVNHKGPAKLEYLCSRFPGGFIYAGDGASDLGIFKAARASILCDVNSATAAAITEAGLPVLAEFQRRPRSWRTWSDALRVHQWSKNFLIFVPLVAGHAVGDPDKLAAATLGFAILCVLASATYLINDLADLEADRQHPTKRRRPFAGGALPPIFGIVGAPLMILSALAAAYVLSKPFAAALFIYLLVTTGYSYGLKRLPLFDAFIIAALFTFRIVMGTVVIGLDYSPWLLSFSMSFFLSLALAKRHSEVIQASRSDASEIAGRGYRGDDWPLTLTFGIGAGLISVVIMLLYLTNDAAPSGFYRHIAWLYAMPALIMVWLMRIWLVSHRMQLHDDPVIFALKDRGSLFLGLVAACAFYFAL